jgi:hypothetical protein
MARDDGGTTAAAVVLILLALVLAALAIAGVLPAALAWILSRLRGAQAAPDRVQPTQPATPTTGPRVRVPSRAPASAPEPAYVPGEPAPRSSRAARPPNAGLPVPNGSEVLPSPLIDRILRDLRLPVPPGLEGGVPSEAGG